jgi:hypothetical protein
VRERDLFGHRASRRRAILTSNVNVFRDPQQRLKVFWLLSSKIGWEHRIKRFNALLLHQGSRQPIGASLATAWRGHRSKTALEQQRTAASHRLIR